MSEFPVITRYEVVGAEDVIRTNAQLWQSYRDGGLNVKEFSTALKDNMEGTYAMRRAYSGMRMALRVEMAPLLESAKILNDVGRIGRDVVQMWQAYTLGQLRIERATRDVVDAQKDVAKWQQLYNQYLRDFGVDSSYSKDASENLTNAYKHLKEAQDAAAKAQSDMTLGFVGMALESASVISNVISLATHIKMLQATITATTGASAAGGFLGTGLTLGTLGSAALAAAPPIAAVGAGYWLAQQIQPVGQGEAVYEGAKGMQELGLTAEQLKIEMEETVTMNKAFSGSLQELIKYMEKYNLTAEGKIGVEYTFGGKAGMVYLTPEEWTQLKTLVKGEGQHGIDYIYETGYYRLHKGERVLNPEQTRLSVAETARPIRADVNQTNHIYNMVDAERAAQLAYQEFMKKLAAKV